MDALSAPSAHHRLDHLIWPTPDLAGAVTELERRLGVRAAPGGRHPEWGTHNALVALSADQYQCRGCSRRSGGRAVI